MSKLRENYENSFSQKFSGFMSGDLETLDTEAPPDINDNFEEELYECYKKDFFDEFSKADDEHKHRMYKKFIERKSIRSIDTLISVLSVIFCVVIIGVLLMCVAYLPVFGDTTNPDNNVVIERYIENGMAETGATNVVAGMILDYRAFDTYGESNVLFIACCCVLILLRWDSGEGDEEDRPVIKDFERDPIVEKIAKVMIPIVFLFGIYIILNGHLSPGGGFSGGAIMGSGMILFANEFGFEKMEKFFNYKTFKAVTFGALLCYGLAKSYSFFTGANGINSIISLGTPGNILSAGLILYLNIFVGLVVACTMYGFYSLFKRGRI